MEYYIFPWPMRFLHLLWFLDLMFYLLKSIFFVNHFIYLFIFMPNGRSLITLLWINTLQILHVTTISSEEFLPFRIVLDHRKFYLQIGVTNRGWRKVSNGLALTHSFWCSTPTQYTEKYVIYNLSWEFLAFLVQPILVHSFIK